MQPDKENPADRARWIIMATAINNTLAKEYAKRSGADGFVAKDHDGRKFQDRLYETIREVMDLRQQPKVKTS